MKHSELQSAKAVSTEEYNKVVQELKEARGRHQDELKRNQERHLAELQSLREAKSKLQKENRGTLSLHALFSPEACRHLEVVV